MRFLSKPAIGMHSGNTFKAHQEPPSRRGASHSSHDKPSAMRPKRLTTATQRVKSMRLVGGSVGEVSVLKGLLVVVGHTAMFSGYAMHLWQVLLWDSLDGMIPA
jgi:hypothetical protein